VEDANQKAFEQAIRDANLPNFPDFNETKARLEEAAKANIQHTWRQRGPQLFCSSCPHEHAQWIGIRKKLVGFNDKGAPIIEPM
jgi:hypothetical protein